MRIAVIGAGNGGQATAAHLGAAGHAVRIFDRFPQSLGDLPATRRVRAVGAIEATATLELATVDMAEAVDGAELILVTVPGFALAWVATTMAPLLRGTEVVILHPGGVGGALEVRRHWDQLGVDPGVVLAETDTLLYACRLGEPGEVDVKAVKKRLLLAALPAARTREALSRMAPLFQSVRPASSVLETSLGTLNPIIHPTITLLNAGPIERRDHPFDFYGEGVTSAAARLLEAVDGERLEIAHAYGVPATSLLAWSPVAYGVSAPDLVSLYRSMAETVYQGIGTPQALDARYVTEDVPLGLVPLAALAAIAGVPTPTIDAVVTVMGALSGTDFRDNGRTAERMGIEGWSLADVVRHVGENGAGTEATARVESRVEMQT